MSEQPGGQERRFGVHPGERTPFVGREDERAALRRMLDDAAAGRGGLAMIGGEPGVGKTRLAEELAAEARDCGFLTATGHSYDMEGGLPYQPFAEVMEALARAVPADAFQAWLGDDATDVARVAPVLRRLFPDLAPSGDLPPEEGRRIVMAAWCGFLERAASALPLLLILDDVHWADESSLLLIEHLARRLAGMPVLVLCTYRDVELAAGRPLAKTLQELIRQRLASDILLRRLPEPGVAEMIGAHGAGAPPPGLVSVVYKETEGNPFFVEEVVRHLAEEGRLFADGGAWASGVAIGELEVPRSVRLVIEQRLGRLSQGCRQLLACSAVAGREFSLDVAGALTDLGPDALIDAIDEAGKAALITDASRGTEVRYTFSHELMRQTLLAGISLPRRQRLHLRVAEAMERLYAPNLEPHVPDLAFHYRQAGRGAEEKAIDYSVRAGGAAARAFAWGEAITHYEAALESLENASAPDLRRRMEVLLALGEACQSAGELRRAYEELAPLAFDLAVSQGDDQAAARAALLACGSLMSQMAGMAWVRPDFLRWVGELDRVARAGTVDRIRADVFLAQLDYHGARQEEAVERLLRANALARELGANDAVLLYIFWTYAIGASGPRFSVSKRQWVDEARLLLSKLPRGVPAISAANAGMLIVSEALLWGDRDQAEADVELISRLEATLPSEMRLGAGEQFRDVLFRFMDGDLEAAAWASTALITRMVFGDVQQVGQTVYGITFGVPARYYLGQGAAAFPNIIASDQVMFAPIRSVLLASFGRPDEARAILVKRRELEPAEAPGAPDTWMTDQLVRYMEAATLIGDKELAAWFAAPLWDCGAVTTGWSYTTMVNRHLGAAAALLGQPDRARQYFERALAEGVAMRFRPEVALTRLGLAELLLNHFPASRAEALEHLAFATSEFEAMKMAPSLERARAAAQQVSSRPAPRPTFPDGLSEREVEVLRLLAQGRTNQQIADSLFISLNTVARHVSNIFDKTGAANRTEAAAYAVRHELTRQGQSSPEGGYR